MAFIAIRNMVTSILRGRPPFRPRARAAANPARVRSAMSSRSNSARLAKIPNTSRPLTVAVSISAPAPDSTRRPMPRSRRPSTVATKCRRSRPRRSSFQMTENYPAAALSCRHQDLADDPFVRMLCLHRCARHRHWLQSAHRVASRGVGSRPLLIPVHIQRAWQLVPQEKTRCTMQPCFDFRNGFSCDICVDFRPIPRPQEKRTFSGQFKSCSRDVYAPGRTIP